MSSADTRPSAAPPGQSVAKYVWLNLGILFVWTVASTAIGRIGKFDVPFAVALGVWIGIMWLVGHTFAADVGRAPDQSEKQRFAGWSTLGALAISLAVFLGSLAVVGDPGEFRDILREWAAGFSARPAYWSLIGAGWTMVLAALTYGLTYYAFQFCAGRMLGTARRTWRTKGVDGHNGGGSD